MAGVNIRAATAADHPACCVAVARCGPATPSDLPDAAAFAVLVRSGTALVALADTAIVGYLLASPLAYEGDAPVSLWIDALAVVPEWRRRGLAVALCAALASHAREAAARAILTSPPADPALAALLARVGFVAHRDGVLLWRLDES